MNLTFFEKIAIMLEMKQLSNLKLSRISEKTPLPFNMAVCSTPPPPARSIIAPDGA
jgi:hypothetical protein